VADKRYRVTKMVEARRLNPKSGVPLTEPPTPMPFGALLEDLREDRDLYKFSYLGKPFQCPIDILKPAMELFKSGAVESEAAERVEVLVESVPEPVPAAVSAAPAPFQWEPVATSHGPLLRAKVPGGWFVMAARASSLTFYPDPKHSWDGASS
jgi:hypothetical protein